MIDPNTSPNGEEFEAYNLRRWGGSGWTIRLRQLGQKDGASFQNWKWWPNTLKAHQLIQYVEKKHGVDTNKSNAALFHALYEEGENVSLSDTLVKIAVDQLGLSDGNNDDGANSSAGGTLREYLEEDAGAEEVLEDIRRSRRLYRTESVPTFVIEREGGDGGKAPIILSGAQPSAAFLRAFAQLV